MVPSAAALQQIAASRQQGASVPQTPPAPAAGVPQANRLAPSASQPAPLAPPGNQATNPVVATLLRREGVGRYMAYLPGHSTPVNVAHPAVAVHIGDGTQTVYDHNDGVSPLRTLHDLYHSGDLPQGLKNLIPTAPPAPPLTDSRGTPVAAPSPNVPGNVATAWRNPQAILPGVPSVTRPAGPLAARPYVPGAGNQGGLGSATTNPMMLPNANLTAVGGVKAPAPITTPLSVLAQPNQTGGVGTSPLSGVGATAPGTFAVPSAATIPARRAA